jgi:hypothetical protein
VEEEHGHRAADGEIADLVDQEERWEDKGLEPLAEAAGGLGFFERSDEVGERTVVDAAPALGAGNGQADGEVGFPDPRGPEEDDVFSALDKPQRVETVDLLALERGLGAEGSRGMPRAQNRRAHLPQERPSRVGEGQGDPRCRLVITPFGRPGITAMCAIFVAAYVQSEVAANTARAATIDHATFSHWATLWEIRRSVRPLRAKLM